MEFIQSQKMRSSPRLSVSTLQPARRGPRHRSGSAARRGWSSGNPWSRLARHSASPIQPCP